LRRLNIRLLRLLELRLLWLLELRLLWLLELRLLRLLELRLLWLLHGMAGLLSQPGGLLLPGLRVNSRAASGTEFCIVV